MSIKFFVVFVALVAACLADLRYNSFDSSNAGDFQFNGVATYSDRRLVLTPSVASVVGSIFYREPITLGATYSFSAAFTMLMTEGVFNDYSGNGGDGIVFVLNTVSNTARSTSGGIGYTGIARSIGIEFDTWQTNEVGDINGNHIGINTNGNSRSIDQIAFASFFNDNNFKYVWIEYNGPTQTLEIRIANEDTRPTAAAMSRIMDLSSILLSPNVYVGWTSSTGGAKSRHMITNFRFASDYAPIVASSSICGNGIVEGFEPCDGEACCDSTCHFATSAVTCRASAGICDIAETCTGSSALCPYDRYSPPATPCRASNGICDYPESCTGQSTSCPADIFKPSTTVCRTSNGICDVAETCTGSSSSCPADVFQPSSTLCRASNGACDAAETCTGSSSTCPADRFQPSSTMCRASIGPCDLPETCTGTSSTCPADRFQPSSTLCRASNGDCDAAETCTGSSSTCPADGFKPSSTVCRASIGICDVAETCTGSASSCPVDIFQSSSTVCRGSNGVCDAAETCTGSSSSCPTDGFQSSSTVCRASIGPCDTAETCTGQSASCGVDVSGSFETPCTGLTLTVVGIPTSWLDFDVISFGDFYGNGDVEGRVAVKNNAVVADDWSVGRHIIRRTVYDFEFELVVGGDFDFGSSISVYHNSGLASFLFVGNGLQSNTALDFIAFSCNGVVGCLDSQFDAVQQCYGNYQTSMASHATNVVTNIRGSALYVTCNSMTESTYYMDLIPEDMSRYSWTELTACNPNARWIINVRGTGPVTFPCSVFPADASQVVYNIIGSGRIIDIQNTILKGNLVAPYNTVRQTTSAINGKVIAAQVISSQINRAQCFSP